MATMTTRLVSGLGLGLGLLAATGCFTNELDPSIAGVFACGREADGADCPDDMSCSSGRCEADATLPRVTISGPADGDFQAFDPDAGDTIAETILFSVSGDFTLVDPASTDEHVYGEGHVIITVDGTQVATITDGVALAGGREIPVDIPNTVGAHRIAVELRRNDGEPYDHRDSSQRNLFWLSDGTPRIAITKPWPGERVPLGEEVIDVEVGVVDFQLAVAGTAPIQGQGHAHIHYDDPFPECVDSACDGGYIVIADAPLEGGKFAEPSENVIARLPEEDSARDVELTAILRHADHPPYLLPDSGDGVTFPPETGEIVIDTITIRRE